VADFDETGLYEQLSQLVRTTMQNRDLFVQAWVAETGLLPSESEMVHEQTTEGNVIRMTCYIRKRRDR